MAKKKITGATTRKRPKGQPKVAELVSNRTIIALPVNPARAATAGNKVEKFDGGSVGAIVEKAGAPTLDLELKVTARGVPAGQDPTAAVAAMTYGADDPAEVVGDFSADSLVAKVRLAKPPAGAGEIEKRPLLDQRLQSLAIEDLLTNPEVRKLLKKPGGRERLMAAIDAQIRQVQDEADKAKARRDVAAAGDGG